MVDTELINVVYVVFGGFVGSSILTLFPYFQGKNDIEQRQEQIRRKPEADLTPEEKVLMEYKSPGFFAEYKYRFFFGLLTGIGTTLAFLQGGLGSLGGMTAGAALFAGITASGFFSSLADKIRSSGTDVTIKTVKKVEDK